MGPVHHDSPAGGIIVYALLKPVECQAWAEGAVVFYAGPEKAERTLKGTRAVGEFRRIK